MYEPARVWESAPGLEEALAQQAMERGLVVVAGAGISAPVPTDLPSGGKTGALLSEQLRRLGKEDLIGDCDPTNLLCVADALETQAGGADLLQGLLRQLAPWLTATPNFGHRALALLVAEGLIQLVLTNWDDCVERGVELSPRINAVISDDDRAHVAPPRVLKVHGCASRYGSLLASTEDLKDPPLWALHELGASLGTEPVVFLGVGSVAAYTRRRIVQIIEALNAPEWIYVVARTIGPDWNEIVPALVGDHSEEKDADVFLDGVLRAIVRIVFVSASEKAEAIGDPAIAGLDSVRRGFEASGAFDLMMWFRASLVDWPPEGRGLTGVEGMRGLLAVCVLSAGAEMEFISPGALQLDGVLYCLLVSRNLPAYDVIKRAQARAEQLAGLGHVTKTPLRAVSIGHVGSFSGGSAPRSIVADTSPTSVLDGPLGTAIEYVSGDGLIAEAG